MSNTATSAEWEEMFAQSSKEHSDLVTRMRRSYFWFKNSHFVNAAECDWLKHQLSEHSRAK